MTHASVADTPVLLRRWLASQGAGVVAVQVDSHGVAWHSAARQGMPELGDDTLFELGSITKTLMALLLADAVQRGELKLTDAVQDALPARQPLRDHRGSPITWADLATHRSGLPRLATNMAPADLADPYADYSASALLAFLKTWQPTRTRDTAFEYSNLGFGLLGQALAWRAGQPLAALLRHRVLTPLGLAPGDMLLPEAASPAPVAGHDAQGQPVKRWRFADATAGAGAVLATPRGVARYAQALLGLYEHPLQDAMALCLRRHADGPNDINPVGLAWLLAPLNGRTLHNHDGGTFGFSTALWLDPTRRRAVAVLANAGAPPVGRLALHLLDSAVPLPG